ncbi:Mannan endo-16-alpha-mannosidase DFG5 [Spathaspora sp. JA1]|nr:Mannan endo-16-alpha-mannosidase DFG5 [Spathaspora sp. JA1]
MLSLKFMNTYCIALVCTLFTPSLFVLAFDLDINSHDNICAAAKLAADGAWNYYDGFNYGGVIGMFIPPNYWWNSGQTFGGLLDYYVLCDPTNETLRKDIINGMYSQAGDYFDYVPLNQTMTEGNDDQGVWGMTLMEAVERDFDQPEGHTWLELANNLFDSLNSRWDTKQCGGGLRWQMYEWNNGYNYKNTVSNGCLFHIAARLARVTGNETYFDIANKVWKWMEDVRFLDEYKGNFWLHDGAEVETDCQEVTPLRWSYNYGIMLSGSAYMYNITKSEKWKNRTNVILDASLEYFFEDKIMQETTCVRQDRCNNDQRSFRSLFARSLALTSRVMPDSRSKILPYLQKSAQGAAASCSGGSDGISCGSDWSLGSWDGVYGLGEQASALETIISFIVKEPTPVEPRLFKETEAEETSKTASKSKPSESTSSGESVSKPNQISLKKSKAHFHDISFFTIWVPFLLELF